MTSLPQMVRSQRWLATCWLVLVLAAVAHNVWLWAGQHIQLETDVLAMLPQDEQDRGVAMATRKMAEAAGQRVVVLVGGHDWTGARAAADAYAKTLTGRGVQLQYAVGEAQSEAWLSFFTPYAPALLTTAQRQYLQEQSVEALAQVSLSALYQAMGQPRLLSWQADPLNQFSAWLSERASESRVRVVDGRLALQVDEQHYALLLLQPRQAAFATHSPLPDWLATAKAAALAAQPRVQVHAAGVPLYAAAAASQAEREVHTIGLGSLLGMLVLTLFAFSALRPRLLVMLSIAVGLLCAISVSALVFERLHLITLVFGASLVGVAENYGSNYFTARLDRPVDERFAMLREQAPTLWLAMLTTVIGYALLAATPFPGLAQMALFSAVGLLAAFVTVLWWFPLLDRGELPHTRLTRAVGGLRQHWPSLARRGWRLGLGLLVATILLAGSMKFSSDDDIRRLQSAPAALLEDQKIISRVLDMPGVGQFYLIEAPSEELLLQREEALKLKLDQAVADKQLAGYQAVSDWLPSQARQRENQQLRAAKLDGPHGVRAMVASQLGEAPPLTSQAAAPLLPHTWLAAKVSEPLRHQWLGRFEGGFASVILLRGVSRPEQLQQLAQYANPSQGVRWVDKVGEISRVMARYRTIMGWVIACAYLLVGIALYWRFGRQAWRALLPTLLASSLSVAILALFGQPLQLFNVLALLIVLGMGVDYGIFMLAQPARQLLRPFLSISLAACATLLSFGLLALSGTPALRAFGLTMLIGIALCWALTPLFLPEDQSI